MSSNYSSLKQEAIKRDDVDGSLKRIKYDDVDNCEDHEDLGPTEITDIATNCLEEIFKSLELNDLLNVADTCTHFREIAEFIVSKKFAKKSILINELRVSRIRSICVQDNFVRLNDLRSILQTLRIFGHLIGKLEVNGNYYNHLTEETIDFSAKAIGILSYYIGHYCVCSLTELIITKPISFNLFKKPFLKVEKIEITHGHSFRGQLKSGWFIKLFPNVRHLKYENEFGYFSDFKCIVDHFPKLEHLNISNTYAHGKNSFQNISMTEDDCAANNMNVVNSLRLNQQLTNLSLPFISDIGILQKISEQQQNLEYLAIQYAPNEATNLDMGTVHFQNVRKFKICLCNLNETRIMDTEMAKIPFTFDHLQELTVQTCFLYSDEFFNFIKMHQSITKLNLRSCARPTFNLPDSRRLLAALPMLKDIYLLCY